MTTRRAEGPSSAARRRPCPFLRPAAASIHAAYITGGRIKDELLSRQPHYVDLAAGWVRLDPGETKTSEGRMFALTPDLQALLEGQLAETRALERETGRIIPWLFLRDGAQIGPLSTKGTQPRKLNPELAA